MFVHASGRIMTEGGVRRLSEITDCDKGFPNLNLLQGHGDATYVSNAHSSGMKVYKHTFKLGAYDGQLIVRASEKLSCERAYGLHGNAYSLTLLKCELDPTFDGYGAEKA